LPEIGGAATEPVIRAFANNTGSDVPLQPQRGPRRWQIHDDRIFEILIDQLRREPSSGAGKPGDLR